MEPAPALRLVTALAFASLCSCSAEPSRSLAVVAAESPRASDSSAEPVSNYKDERKARALRGISYESGRALVDPATASLVVAGPDAAAARRALQEGRELLAANARIEAIAACTRAVLLAPSDAQNYEGLGQALLAMRMVREATAALRSGVDLDPQSVSLRFALADALARGDDRRGAVAELEETLRRDPSHALAHERLAIQHYYLDAPAAAWREVHAAEALGRAVPGQFRVLLAQRMTEPAR